MIIFIPINFPCPSPPHSLLCQLVSFYFQVFPSFSGDKMNFIRICLQEHGPHTNGYITKENISSPFTAYGSIERDPHELLPQYTLLRVRQDFTLKPTLIIYQGWPSTCSDPLTSASRGWIWKRLLWDKPNSLSFAYGWITLVIKSLF